MASKERAFSQILAFTWNLRGKEKSLKLACEYLAGKGTCIACFQEAPARLKEQHILTWSRGALVPLTPLNGDQRVLLVVSRDIQLQAAPVVFIPGVLREAAERMVGATVSAPGFSALQLVGVHFPDLRNLPRDWPRERIVGSLSDEMRQFWTGGPLIMLGDFNAHPFDREIALRTTLWATRDAAELGDERDPVPAKDDFGMGIYHRGATYPSRDALAAVRTFQKLRPLYNPMWRWLPERAAHPRGTFYRKHDDSVVSWQCLDQVLVSPDLAGCIDRVDILARMNAATLIEADKVRMNDDYGDHLPVELALISKGDAHEQAA
jgi:endonuclease/exonuclease/phosphatase family metal-dependent hydrolase